MKTNVERVKEFLDRFDIEEAIFNKKAGLGNAAISNNLKNKGSFTNKSLEKILLNYPEIRKEWLYWGKGEMLVSDEAEIKKPDNISRAEFDRVVEENKKLKDELLDLSRKLILLLGKK